MTPKSIDQNNFSNATFCICALFARKKRTELVKYS